MTRQAGTPAAASAGAPVGNATAANSFEVVVTLRSRFPQYGTALAAPVGRGLARTGITPNVITTLGLVFTAIATGVVAAGHPVIGGWVLVAGGLMDTFDGAVARASGRTSPFGGFYDSVTDRISDGVILGGIAWWLRDQPRLFILVIVALVGAEVTSYVRAKAEAIDLDCSVGILERAERAVLLMLALIFNRWLLEPVLWVLAIGATTTVVQRIHHVWCQIARDLPEELVALTLHDRAWSRAFMRAARTFYGEQNYQEARRNAQDLSGSRPASRSAGRSPAVAGEALGGTVVATEGEHPAPDGRPTPGTDGHPTLSDDGQPSLRDDGQPPLRRDGKPVTGTDGDHSQATGEGSVPADPKQPASRDRGAST